MKTISTARASSGPASSPYGLAPSLPARSTPTSTCCRTSGGVGYYSLDSNEVNLLDGASTLEAMFGPMSYSESYLPAVLKAAAKRGITACWWAVAQYDFKYDPKRVKRAIATQPVFL